MLLYPHGFVPCERRPCVDRLTSDNHREAKGVKHGQGLAEPEKELFGECGHEGRRRRLECSTKNCYEPLAVLEARAAVVPVRRNRPVPYCHLKRVRAGLATPSEPKFSNAR
jgi:hypothetical protein